MPENATKLNDIIKSADGFVISLAEHNGSFSAAFKNTTDWLSRIDVKVWNGKPMLLMASSPGKRGGKSVLETAKTIYPHAGANIIADFSLPSFHENFSQEGIADADLKESLEQKIQAMNEALQ
jgi:NAD(P)H-dependent FMN reductase